MNKILCFLLFVSAVFSACSSRNTNVYLSKYGDKYASSATSVVYSLPQTRVNVKVDFVQIQTKRGPYADYANRLLGLPSVPMRDSERWQISAVSIQSTTEPDPKHIYSLSFKNYPQNLDYLMRFSKNGLILDLSQQSVVSQAITAVNSDAPLDYQFVNSTTQENQIETMDTVFRTILTDTAFVRVPIVQRKVTGKTTEEQAREAAQQIFNLRQIRIDMLSGNTDYHPDGMALDLLLKSLDTQEAQLLSLFNGVNIERRYSRQFSFVPERTDVTHTLFYFSEKSGIIKGNAADAQKVWFQVSDAASSYEGKIPEKMKNVLLYRIPLAVRVVVGIDKTEISSQTPMIYQLGTLSAFPIITK